MVVPRGKNLKIYLPVVIGTIPLCIAVLPPVPSDQIVFVNNRGLPSGVYPQMPLHPQPGWQSAAGAP